MKSYKLFLLLCILLTACGKIEETPSDMLCNKLEEMFSTPGDSWEKYENSIISWTTEVAKHAPENLSEAEKKEAIKQLKEQVNKQTKQLKKMSQKERLNELRNLSQELANGSFGCSSKVAEIVKNHIEEQYPNIFTNYGVCANPDLIWYFISSQDVPSKCLLEIRPYETKALQQVSDGTLAIFLAPSGFSNTIFFISKNKIDFNLVDNMPIPEGIFVRDGVYSYTNVFGASKRIIRLKRIK